MEMKANLKNIEFDNPLLTASGTFSEDYLEFYGKKIPFGGIVVKTYTAKERIGNTGKRIKEIPCGMMNSIGLANPGIEHLDISMYEMTKKPIILSIAVLDESELPLFEKAIKKNSVKIIELNLSCPNIKGKAVLTDFSEISSLLTNIRKQFSNLILIAKLSYDQANEPNVKLLTELGYDGITVINTLPGMDVDIVNRKFYFDNKVAGISGRFLLPIGLRVVYNLKKWTNLPIIACGGVWDWTDVVKYIMIGAELVQIGSAIFSDPLRPVKILDELENYIKNAGLQSLNEIRGVLK